MARLAGLIPWFNSPPDELHARTAQRLLEIYLRDSDAGDGLAELPWVADGVTAVEESSLELLLRLAENDAMPVLAGSLSWAADGVTKPEEQVLGLLVSVGNSEFANLVASLSWISDEMSVHEQQAIQTLFEFRATTEETAILASSFSWVADGVDYSEGSVLRVLLDIALSDPPTGQRVTSFPWVANGVRASESTALSGLAQMAALDPTVGAVVTAFSWVADGINRGEGEVLDLLARIARTDQPATKRLVGFRWLMAGPDIGFTGNDFSAPGTLELFLRLAEADREVSQQVVALPWLADRILVDEWQTLEALAELVEIDPTVAQRVVGQAWFADGPTRAELEALQSLVTAFAADSEAAKAWFTRLEDDLDAGMALLAVLAWAHDTSDLLYSELLSSPHVESATVSLPLTGDVSLWVLQTTASPEDENLIEEVETVVRAAEEFMGAPFPVLDVILVVPRAEDHGLRGGGKFWGDFITVTRRESRPLGLGFLYHELSHYYFPIEIGPPWLLEGGANFLRLYAFEQAGRSEPLLSVGLMEWVFERVQSSCFDDGIETIHELNQQTYGQLYPVHSCAYSLGEYFLLRLYGTIGRDALSAALRELYLRIGERGYPRNEADIVWYEEMIFQVLLEHTPPEKEQEFRELYDELHGGPYSGAG